MLEIVAQEEMIIRKSSHASIDAGSEFWKPIHS
jgi:hypothetical protein